MRHELVQETKQLQKLILSPQMQQALHLLQLPIQELTSLIDEELALNPLLDYPDEELPEILPEVERESRTSTEREEEDLRAFIENTVAYETSLAEHLIEQANETFEEREKQVWATTLIGYLDHNGFLTTDLEEIALLEEIPLKALEEILEEIQRFDPAGVGARSHREAFLIQLKRLGKEGSLAYRIIDTHFDEMLHNRIPQIAKKLKKESEEVHRTILEEIASLDLRPGANCPEGHYKERTQHLTPDLTIHSNEGKFAIEINEGKLPSLRFKPRYLALLHENALSEEERAYLEERLASGQWLLRNLHERNQTLYRIGEELIVRQRPFFTDPQGQLLPLTMKEVADKLELHESTIARAVAQKALCCARGTFPLRFFFTNAYQSEQGESISSNAVKACLQEIIAQEDKYAPLSDEVISKMIKEKGIRCARRTVAKYRQELNIANTTQRKRHR